MIRATIAAVASACALAAAPAGAQVRSWNEVGVTAAIVPGVRVGVDQELRFDPSRRIDVFRPGLHASWRARKWLSLRLGYRFEVEPKYTRGDDYADAWHETYADATLRAKVERVRLSLRLRLEDKRGRPWDEDGALVRSRAFRQRLEAEWPVWGPASLVGSGELFFEVADPDGPRDKWRAGAGVSVAKGRHEVSARYLRQQKLAPGGEADDIVSISYELTL